MSDDDGKVVTLVPRGQELTVSADRSTSGRFVVYVEGGEIKEVTRVDGFHLVHAETYWKLRGNLSRMVQQLRWVTGDQNAGVFDVTLDAVPGE